MNAVRPLLRFGGSALLASVISSAAAFVACGNDAATGGTASESTIPTDSNVDGGSDGGGGSRPPPAAAGFIADAHSEDALAEAAVADATSDANVPHSDPLQVTCGAVSCNTGPGSFEVCCGEDGGACLKTPGLECGGYQVAACDEAADCSAGSTCCSTPPSVTRKFGAVCLGSAAAGICEFNGGVQLCKTKAECGGGLPCIPNTCKGRTFFSCGAPPAWFCP